MSDTSIAAFERAMTAALEWMETARTTDFARFTEDEARSLFGYFVDAYAFEMLKTWKGENIRKVGTPVRKIEDFS